MFLVIIASRESPVFFGTFFQFEEYPSNFVLGNPRPKTNTYNLIGLKNKILQRVFSKTVNGFII